MKDNFDFLSDLFVSIEKEKDRQQQADLEEREKISDYTDLEETAQNFDYCQLTDCIFSESNFKEIKIGSCTSKYLKQKIQYGFKIRWFLRELSNEELVNTLLMILFAALMFFARNRLGQVTDTAGTVTAQAYFYLALGFLSGGISFTLAHKILVSMANKLFGDELEGEAHYKVIIKDRRKIELYHLRLLFITLQVNDFKPQIELLFFSNETAKIYLKVHKPKKLIKN